MMEVIDKVVEFISVYLPVIISVVGSFSLIASMTPNSVDNKIAQFLMDVINFLGANVNKAANKDA